MIQCLWCEIVMSDVVIVFKPDEDLNAIFSLAQLDVDR